MPNSKLFKDGMILGNIHILQEVDTRLYHRNTAKP